MIKVLARICQERKWGYESFHGKLSFEEKDQAIQTFSEDKNCFILLAGLKAGGVGLNLTAANRVIIIDLWWNQYVETQAFCRVYRIGQDREVDMVRIVVKDTVDEEILMMQEKKNVSRSGIFYSETRMLILYSLKLIRRWRANTDPGG
jgi:SNF2 family DNA or RNA helicase